ncbi:MAG: restriction endonuclease [Rhodococcus sp.]|nr:restriction endonuclease [Rhodococcus sp. (in: high G+C Gram-positive bacteria)]
MTESLSLDAPKASFTLRSRNPDVLSCIANLSNDEVFTPPEFANRMLDTLAEGWADANDGADIWSDPTVKFLDPFTKSGVFLREITKRLTVGLADQIPDLEDRVDHILTKQVFGIGITEITTLLARRSLYCSKWANGEHSIAKSFDNPDGNIWFERTEHTWVGGTEWVYTADENGNRIKQFTNGRCKFCGASQKSLGRGEDRETHAYKFIHTNDAAATLSSMFGEEMHFDVVVGNPPYQLSDGGQGASATPIYNKFVEQALALEPRLLSMVIPARWMFGGRGLNAFRSEMLSDKRIRNLVDFPDSRQAFQGVDVAGGICYFLWDRDNPGPCTVVSHDPTGQVTTSVRPLLEPGAEVFVRSNQGLEVIRKVCKTEVGGGTVLPTEKRFERRVSGQKPFGLRTYFRGGNQGGGRDVLVLQSGGRAWVARKDIPEGRELIDRWKVFTSKSSSEHAGQADSSGRRKVLSLSGVLEPGSAVTETYVILGHFDTQDEAENCFSYACTKFFRFMIAIRTSAQDLPRSAYSFVPDQDFSRAWTDEDLYKKYGLSDAEIELIERTIKPMDPKGDGS